MVAASKTRGDGGGSAECLGGRSANIGSCWAWVKSFTRDHDGMSVMVVGL